MDHTVCTICFLQCDPREIEPQMEYSNEFIRIRTVGFGRKVWTQILILELADSFDSFSGLPTNLIGSYRVIHYPPLYKSS